MAIVLEGYINEEQNSIVRSLCAKEVAAKDIHREVFPVYRGEEFVALNCSQTGSKVSPITKKLRCLNG
jgi:hypothetical protein